MRNITQMIRHLMGTRALTDEALAWFIERTYCLPDGRDPLDMRAVSARGGTAPCDDTGERASRANDDTAATGTAMEKPLTMAELEERIKNMRRDWDAHLAALLPLARAIDRDADEDNAPAIILSVSRDVIKGLLSERIAGDDCFFSELWMLIEFPSMYELVEADTEEPLAKDFDRKLRNETVPATDGEPENVPLLLRIRSHQKVEFIITQRVQAGNNLSADPHRGTAGSGLKEVFIDCFLSHSAPITNFKI